MPDVYEGDRPFIFVSYAHADDDAVLPLIAALVAEGYRVWWDRGIELAMPFPDYIANRVFDCECFVPLMSRASLRSNWCNAEVNYALELNKTILPVYLEDVELPRGLHMRLCYRQHLTRGKFDSDDALYRELFRARVLDPCLKPEGARRRGAKAKGSQPEVSVATTGVRVAEPSAGLGKITQSELVVSVVPGASLADYSWDGLKELSQAIAAAGSDEEGLDIAKAYGLVGEDGRLQGDAKEVVLGDKGKTKAHVRILGFRHDELAGSGRAGISFEFADVPVTHCMNSEWTNKGGWEKSGMRKWLNDAEGGLLGLLPADLRDNVAKAAKRTNNRGKVEENDTACVTTTDDRLWLLSMSEVYGRLSERERNVPWSSVTYDAEGRQYRLYADRSVSTTGYDSCQKRGASSWWWLRSPSARSSFVFRGVGDDGGWSWRDADLDRGVSPGFCF